MILHLCGPRGPDRLNSFNSDGIFAVHSQLIITGDRPQPVSTNDHLFLFNGEIYNNYSSYSYDDSYRTLIIWLRDL